MKKVITTESVPIKLWLDDLEEGALDQAKNLANLPFVFKHVAIMPDSHQGYGMPIGSILATKDVIVPNAVGVDIGCGMCAIRTSLKYDEIKPHLKEIVGSIRKKIPVGFNHHKEKQNIPEGLDLRNMLSLPELPIIFQEFDKSLYSLGTLGGGNHFIEIQKGKDEDILVMIHSGSRNLGYKVAEYYNKIAEELNEKWFSKADIKHKLAFLPIGTKEADDYINEMNYCIDYALANRKLMMDRTIESIREFFPEMETYGEMVNKSHNLARIENHFGQSVWVHRKGATSARKGEVGLIPGSQGTKSYIVEGLGNKESFESCSHGAGRAMGRKEAQRRLNVNNEIEMLDEQGILHAIRGVDDLDEAPSAYKDIQMVMNNQKDLVNILEELSPLAVIKG